MVRGSKDAALALALRRLVNSRLAAFGEVIELGLDTRGRRAQARIALRGEAHPIEVDVRQYDLERVGGDYCLVIADAVASREWLTIAARQFVVGRRFFVPRNAAAVLRLVM